MPLIQRYNKNNSFQNRETNRNFTGCQVPHFMIVLIPDTEQFIKSFLDNKMSIFEEYGTFNTSPILKAVYSKRKDLLPRVGQLLCVES